MKKYQIYLRDNLKDICLIRLSKETISRIFDSILLLLIRCNAILGE